MKFNSVCTINTWSERFSQNGNISILYVNDTIHIIEYKDFERSIMVDIDDINIHETKNLISFFFPRNSDDELFFEIKDNIEMIAFRNSKIDCQAICELKLRLNSVLRDVYYAGLYSTLDTEAKIIICDEMERLKKDNPTIYFTSLLNSPELNRDLKKRQSSNEQIKELIQFNDVYCIFCDCYKLNRTDLDFIIHPYIPKASNGKTIFMCSICIENWKEYRDIAEHDNSLVIGEETNEEICSLCSDTPESLVLCSGCMRSYCNICLERILSLNELEDMKRSDNNDWLCVCCIQNVIKNPPLTKSAWKMVTTITSKKGNGHHVTQGCIVPFINKSNNSNKVIPITIANAAEMISKSIILEDNVKSITMPSTKSKNISNKSINEIPITPSSSYDIMNHTRNNKRNKKPISPSIEIPIVVDSYSKQLMNNNKDMKRKRNQLNNIKAEILPLTNNILTEEFYFLQYYSNYKSSCDKYSKSRKGKFLQTDDLCFLCKDGGDLVECDWKCDTAKNGERCLKTYHQYCLSYEVKESDENWCCPRHFCDFCGSKELKYICKYCPITICEKCPKDMVKKYGTNIYCVVENELSGKWCHEPTTSDVQYIICHACVEMIDEKIIHGCTNIKNDKLYTPELIEFMSNEVKNKLKFPGIFTGDVIGLYQKEILPITNQNSIVIKPSPNKIKKQFFFGKKRRSHHRRNNKQNISIEEEDDDDDVEVVGDNTEVESNDKLIINNEDNLSQQYLNNKCLDKKDESLGRNNECSDDIMQNTSNNLINVTTVESGITCIQLINNTSESLNESNKDISNQSDDMIVINTAIVDNIDNNLFASDNDMIKNKELDQFINFTTADNNSNNSVIDNNSSVKSSYSKEKKLTFRKRTPSKIVETSEQLKEEENAIIDQRNDIKNDIRNSSTKQIIIEDHVLSEIITDMNGNNFQQQEEDIDISQLPPSLKKKKNHELQSLIQSNIDILSPIFSSRTREHKNQSQPQKEQPQQQRKPRTLKQEEPKQQQEIKEQQKDSATKKPSRTLRGSDLLPI